jgi:hypothetical protein
MRALLGIVIAVGALATAGAASGDGGPPQNAVQGWDGLSRGAVRYVAVPAGESTSIVKINRRGGRVVSFMAVLGDWGIPVVTFDDGGSALLRDDRTLVLGEVTSGLTLRKRSSFLLVDTSHLRTIARIDLPGHFAFDAVSPDAHYLYFTEYVSSDFRQYRVRAYDLASGRLLRKIVSDRTSWETTMQGWPLSRVSRSGWAFTLYSTGGRPFIHALDTRHVQAVCINLPWRSEPRYMYDYRLGFDKDGHVVVRGRKGHTLFTVTRDFAT